MNRLMKTLGAFLLCVGICGFVLLSGCGLQGDNGTSYMALDWLYPPQQLYFPAMPFFGLAGVHYQHPEGTYYGEYIAWDGSYYSFYYTIEVNEGEYGMMLLPGSDGLDRFYTMYLYSWGPELYYVDDLATKSLREQLPAEATDLATIRNAPISNQRIELDESLYDLDMSREYRFESRGPGYRLSIEGRCLNPRWRGSSDSPR